MSAAGDILRWCVGELQKAEGKSNAFVVSVRVFFAFSQDGDANRAAFQYLREAAGGTLSHWSPHSRSLAEHVELFETAAVLADLAEGGS